MQLAEVLMERISGSLDRFVADMASHLEARVEAEITRFSTALEASLAAFVLEVSRADADSRNDDPVPHVQGGSERELPLDPDGEVPRTAQAPSEGREEDQRAARLVDPIEQALGPDIAAMLTPKRSVCGVCKETGHNARTCGRTPKQSKLSAAEQWEVIGVAPPPVRRLSPKPEALAVRAGVIRFRAKPPTEPIDDNENAEERWSSERIRAAAADAEANKLRGELPEPHSSWEFR